MLDISFYSTEGQSPIVIDVSEEFYQWLIQTDFAEIGVSRPRKILLDNKELVLSVVDLNKGQISNRHRFREFLVEMIVQEVDAVLAKLGDTPAPQDYQEATCKLRKLQEIRACIEDESYQFLQKA